jgi:hypothetical protein
VNEQWPLYWEKLFAERGMRKYDVVRPLIWCNRAIEWWYRQNLYVFAESDLDCVRDLEQFEPEFNLASNEVMIKSMFPWKSRAWKYAAMFRRMRSRLSRSTSDS